MVARLSLLYRVEYWPVNNSYVQNIHIAKIRMLRWMCGHTKSAWQEWGYSRKARNDLCGRQNERSKTGLVWTCVERRCVDASVGGARVGFRRLCGEKRIDQNSIG